MEKSISVKNLEFRKGCMHCGVTAQSTVQFYRDKKHKGSDTNKKKSLHSRDVKFYPFSALNDLIIQERILSK